MLQMLTGCASRAVNNQVTKAIDNDIGVAEPRSTDTGACGNGEL